MDVLSNLKMMEEGCNSIGSSNTHIIHDAYFKRCEEVFSEGLVKIHQGAISSDWKLRSSELLPDRLACWIKSPDYSDHSESGTMNKLFVKYKKKSKALSQNDRNPYHLDDQTFELLQSILPRTERKKDEAGMCTPRPDALAAVSPHPNPDENLAVDNVIGLQTPHLPPSSSVHSNVNSAVAKLTQGPSQDTLTNTLKEKESIKFYSSLSSKAKELDLLALKEKLQQKDLETQQIVCLLLLKHQELSDVKEMSKLKEVETQLVTEKLKCEVKTYSEVAKRFDIAYEDMRKKLCIAKSNNESFAQQLKAMLEKYERLKTHASTIKKQLFEERTKKRSFQKTTKMMKQMTEELLINQTLLEKQRDAAARELSTCRTKMQVMEKEHKNNISNVQRVEVERSAISAEYEILREKLCKIQEENKNLMQAVQSKEWEKGRAVEKLLESQNVLRQVNAELDESKMQRESIHQLLEASKKEIKQIHHTHKVERLQIQEHQKTCMKQFEDMRIESEALKLVVSKLKKEKHMLKEELENLQEEKAKYNTDCKWERERLREAVRLLQHERGLLLEEMRDLRKDYFSLSDRITERLGQLDQIDASMCITEISSVPQNREPEIGNTAPVTSTTDMIQLIRKKLEEETIQQKSLTAAFTIH